jgi:hypothetical protein
MTPWGGRSLTKDLPLERTTVYGSTSVGRNFPNLVVSSHLLTKLEGTVSEQLPILIG